MNYRLCSSEPTMFNFELFILLSKCHKMSYTNSILIFMFSTLFIYLYTILPCVLAATESFGYILLYHYIHTSNGWFGSRIDDRL